MREDTRDMEKAREERMKEEERKEAGAAEEPRDMDKFGLESREEFRARTQCVLSEISGIVGGEEATGILLACIVVTKDGKNLYSLNGMNLVAFYDVPENTAQLAGQELMKNFLMQLNKYGLIRLEMRGDSGGIKWN